MIRWGRGKSEEGCEWRGRKHDGGGGGDQQVPWVTGSDRVGLFIVHSASCLFLGMFLHGYSALLSHLAISRFRLFPTRI